MYNTFGHNTTNYNALASNISALSLGAIVFNGYSLQNTDIVTQFLVHDNMPDRDFDTGAIPRADGEFILGDFWRKKEVEVNGFIRKTTSSELEAEIDAMKKALAVPEANLDVTVDGIVRRYVATLINGASLFSERKNFHITFIPFSARFSCSAPFAVLTTYDSTVRYDQTSLALNEQIDNAGTVRSKSVLILDFSAASSITAINYRNNTRGEEIELTKNINAGDYIVFDGENLEVTVNGAVQDYDGIFPLLDTGANSITITLTGASGTYTMTEKHKTPYL